MAISTPTNKSRDQVSIASGSATWKSSWFTWAMPPDRFIEGWTFIPPIGNAAPTRIASHEHDLDAAELASAACDHLAFASSLPGGPTLVIPHRLLNLLMRTDTAI
jgi:hypothetical protein